MIAAAPVPAARPTASAPMPGLGARNAPPFILPGEHFAAGLVFLLAGVAGLVWTAPLLASGFYSTTRVIGVAHLFTLGWITTSIMGALYQFLPVATGQPIRSQKLAHVTFALYAPGLAFFVAGLLLSRATPMLAGAAAFGTGVLLFAWNLAATLKRATKHDVTWWALACADFYLVVTLLLGLALAGNLRWGYLGGGRFDAVGTHLHVAIAGWVLLVMVGVGNRLLPMFLLSHGAGERFARAAVALIASGAGVLAFLHHAPALISRWLPAVLLAAGVAAFLAQAALFYRHRHRPALDPGMRLVAAALALLGVGLALAGPMLLADASARVATAYVLVVVLGISLFVAAHYYKIVPFLVWYHRFGPLAGKRPVPRVNELYSSRLASTAALLLVVGVVALAAAVLAGSAAVARVGAIVLAAGASIEATQMLLLSMRKPE
ncbi:MAG TPA: hypothetical protein VF039_00905 [Longimicrobiales bacterium]